jgi:fibronectin type 3 domain-containing protein
MQLLASLAPQTQHEVQLNWDAPTGSSVPIAGYHIYRSINSNSPYQLINPSLETQTTYSDTTVQGGTSYDYVVKTVDTSGAESAPSNATAVTIP